MVLRQRYGHAVGGLTPVARRMLLYIASKSGGEWPRTKAVETRTLDVLERGGYVKFSGAHGAEITPKGWAEIGRP